MQAGRRQHLPFHIEIGEVTRICLYFDIFIARNGFFVNYEELPSEKEKSLREAYKGNCMVYTKQKPFKKYGLIALGELR